MSTWVCNLCGYVYNPQEGDANAGIPAGTSFEDLPADWVCPMCGVGKDSFSEQKEVGPAADQASAPVAALNLQPGIEPAIFKISYGLFVVTSIKGDQINGQCANTVFQITSNPFQIALGINKGNLTHEYIHASGVIGVSILGQQGHDLVRRFGYSSGRGQDKFAGLNYTTGTTGAPLLTGESGAIAFLEGKVGQSLDCGSHTLYLLEVSDGVQSQDAEPMTYAYFRATK
jgi:flavin reductase (DIM6/NTAB) family NADH-FMN oxidoreductase RutF/rubredoxin